MSSKYTFSDYSKRWPGEFAEEVKRLRYLLGKTLIKVHHIGSTSIPGLAAKPIIDLLPVVSDLLELDQVTSSLEKAGYKAWGEYGLEGRRFFTKDANSVRTYNIHAYQQGHADIHRHVAFRDFLRSNHSICEQYASLKREAYRLYPDDINAYNDHKSDWIQRTEQDAMLWFYGVNA